MWMVPHAPRADGVDLWFGAFGAASPGDVMVECEGPGDEVVRVEVAPEWRAIDGGEGTTIQCARAPVGGLAADTTYRLWLRRFGGARVGPPAKVRTLPASVPTSCQPPLQVLLGSCFDRRGEGAPAMARLLRQLDGPRLPHLKVLCGDQVYVDLPVMERIPTGEAALRAFVAGKYLRNWAPSGAPLANGFGDLLRHGANVLVGDDHEFWNNFPFAAAHVPFTYLGRNRELLGRLGREFFRAFQVDYGEGSGLRCHRRVVIGGAEEPARLEVFAIDGRFARSERLAHWPADVAALVEWLGGLSGPGILVLSQPLFEAPQSGVRRSLIDAGIGDFDDFEAIVGALATARHDVLILSGDIHCGRMASATVALSGRRVVEVVASPISLIPGTKFHDGPAFPSFPPRPMRASPRSFDVVTTRGPIRANHVTLLEIVRGSGGLDVVARPIGVDGAPIGEPWAFSLS